MLIITPNPSFPSTCMIVFTVSYNGNKYIYIRLNLWYQLASRIF